MSKSGLMHRFKNLFAENAETQELLLSTSRKIILTTGGIYLAFHILGTLFWTATFSPRIWLCTLVMGVTMGLTLHLLPRYFSLGQAVWFGGLSATIALAFELFGRQEILLLLALFPLMAEVMVGLRGSLFLGALTLIFITVLPSMPFSHTIESGYRAALYLLTIASGIWGWGLSDNLMSAIESSTYHYNEAVKRLQETRQHRAEISVLLNEQSKSNYQLNRLNKMLSLARVQAEEARAERDRFAMAVSHELRSPLNFIIGFSDLMVNSPEIYASRRSWPPGLYEDIQEIYRSSNHLLGLINDILDMGKMDANQMVLFKEKLPVRDLIEEVYEMVRPVVEKKGLWLRMDLGGDLPLLFIDRTRIRQVLLNLITNGMRFTDKGGIILRARRQADDWVRVEVEDTGIGIEPENLQKVFDEFRQVSEGNWRRAEGSGLGLSIGRRFIQLHGGRMGVESEAGKGSVFSFELPGLSQETAEEGIDWTAENARRRETFYEDQNRLVFFLSRSVFWSKMFGQGLSGYQITVFSSPAEMLAAVGQYYPRAVVLDRHFLDQPEIQKFLQEPPYDMPIFTLTIPATSPLQPESLEGIQNYLVKPVTRDRLLEAISALGPQVEHLLVVDDDPSMVRYLTQTIQGAGSSLPARNYHFLTALTGQQALHLLSTEFVDAVMLDLDLPDMDGLNLLARLQADPRYRQLPVMIISAQDMPGALQSPQANTLEIKVNRPIGRQELHEILITALEKLTPAYNETDHKESTPEMIEPEVTANLLESPQNPED